jgi:hypothetical protein
VARFRGFVFSAQHPQISLNGHRRVAFTELTHSAQVRYALAREVAQNQ